VDFLKNKQTFLLFLTHIVYTLPTDTFITSSKTNRPSRVSSTTLPKKEEMMKDDGKERIKTTQEEEKNRKQEGGDECPICLEELPKFANQFARFTCCGKGIHHHCGEDLQSSKMKWNCPMCRAKTPTRGKKEVKYLHPWVKKKEAWAMVMMGQKYRDGTGVKQSYEMARRLFEQAAQQGDAMAMVSLGDMYYEGQGVEQTHERTFEYYEQAAHLGFVSAQYGLGRMYATGQGGPKNETKAHALWTLAAAQGDEEAIKMLPILEKNMKKS